MPYQRRGAVPITDRRQYLTEQEVEEITGIPLATLQRWRAAGSGPVFFKFGAGPKAPVRYHVAEIHRFAEAGRREPIRAGTQGA